MQRQRITVILLIAIVWPYPCGTSGEIDLFAGAGSELAGFDFQAARLSSPTR